MVVKIVVVTTILATFLEFNPNSRLIITFVTADDVGASRMATFRDIPDMPKMLTHSRVRSGESICLKI